MEAPKPEPVNVVMTAREATAGTGDGILKTPSGEANVRVIAVTWYSQALIRALRVYLQSLVGFTLAVGTGAAAGVGVNLPAGDFLHLMITSGSMAVAPAVISLLQNSIEILTRMDTTAPQMRA